MTREDGNAGPRTDWNAWHDDYADPDSALSARLAVVRSEIRRALADHAAKQAERVAPLTVLSACAGDGRDILGVLAEQDEPAEQSRAQVEVTLRRPTAET